MGTVKKSGANVTESRRLSIHGLRAGRRLAEIQGRIQRGDEKPSGFFRTGSRGTSRPRGGRG